MDATDFDPTTDRIAVTTRTGKEIKHRTGKYAEYAVCKGDRVIAWVRPLKSASSWEQATEIADAQAEACDIYRTHIIAR